MTLIIEFYRGKFYIDELIDFKKKVGEDKDYNPNYNNEWDGRGTINFIGQDLMDGGYYYTLKTKSINGKSQAMFGKSKRQVRCIRYTYTAIALSSTSSNTTA